GSTAHLHPFPTRRSSDLPVRRRVDGDPGGVMSALRHLYRNTNDIDFPKLWKRMLVISAILVAASIVSLAAQWVELSIDFEGGSRDRKSTRLNSSHVKISY